MVYIRFRYKDRFTGSNWAYQECLVNSIYDCIKLYGLEEPDVLDYEILDVEDRRYD